MNRCTRCETGSASGNHAWCAPCRLLPVPPQRQHCALCLIDFDGQGHICPQCQEHIANDDRGERIAAGDLTMFYEDVSPAEQDAIIRARKSMNVFGA